MQSREDWLKSGLGEGVTKDSTTESPDKKLQFNWLEYETEETKQASELLHQAATGMKNMEKQTCTFVWKIAQVKKQMWIQMICLQMDL